MNGPGSFNLGIQKESIPPRFRRGGPSFAHLAAEDNVGVGIKRLAVPSLLILLFFGWTSASAFAAPPTVSLNSTFSPGYTSATYSGSVDPGSNEIYVFAEFRPKESAGAWVSEFIQTVEANVGQTVIAYQLFGLSPNTAYEGRLNAYVPGEESAFYSSSPYPTFATKSVDAPDITLDPVSNVTSTSAHLSATINPNASEAAPASLDVEAGFAVDWSFDCDPKCEDLSGTVQADNVSHLIEGDVNNLLPGTEYELFLNGRNAGEDETARQAGPLQFSTPPVPPTIVSANTPVVGVTEATLFAELVPGGAPTTYHFEYGPTSSYGQVTPEATIGGDNSAHQVSATLAGLAPDSEYHWRVVANNSVEPTYGVDHTFNTFDGIPTFLLPDRRAYEQVTQVDKQGIGTQGEKGIIHASPDGERLGYYNISTLPGSEGAQSYGIYLASRSSESWSTQGLLPPATAGKEGSVLTWSEDLTEAYVESFRPGVDEASGSYAFARDSRDGALTVIAHNIGVSPLATSTNNEFLFFSSRGEVLPGIAGPNVYARQKLSGVTKLVSVNNLGSPFSGGSSIPRFEWHHAFAADGSSAYFQDNNEGQLYLRVNPSRPQSALVGGACVEPAAACTVGVSASRRSETDPNGPKPATFLAASYEGSPVAFFTSSAKLTDDATTGSVDQGSDLYRYDAATDTLIDLVPDPVDPDGADVEGALGADANGDWIYFVANGVLGDGASLGATGTDSQGFINLYVWGRTTGIHFVGTVGRQFSDDWSAEQVFTRTARVSKDGQAAIFLAESEDGRENFLRYDAPLKDVLCVTCSPAGANAPTGPRFSGPTLTSLTSVQGPEFVRIFETRNLSANGNRFFFETSAKLVPSDTNGDSGCPEQLLNQSAGVGRCQDVYEWEAPGEASCPDSVATGCFFLISTGKSDRASFFADADTGGSNVFLYTDQQLVGQDQDKYRDIYDARIDGGLASQSPAFAPPCLNETCRGVGPPAPSESSSGSLRFTRSHQTKRHSCRKSFRRGKVRGKKRCVKKKSKKAHSTKRSSK